MRKIPSLTSQRGRQEPNNSMLMMMMRALLVRRAHPPTCCPNRRGVAGPTAAALPSPSSSSKPKSSSFSAAADPFSVAVVGLRRRGRFVVGALPTRRAWKSHGCGSSGGGGSSALLLDGAHRGAASSSFQRRMAMTTAAAAAPAPPARSSSETTMPRPSSSGKDRIHIPDRLLRCSSRSFGSSSSFFGNPTTTTILQSTSRVRVTSIRTLTSSSGSSGGGGINKVMNSAEEALQTLSLPSWDGLRVGVGGFGLGGIPESLLHALARHAPATQLVVSSLTAGTDTQGIGVLLQVPNKVRRLLSSYVGENKLLEQQYFDGRLQLELVPQGTLAERWNAAGGGIPAFYTPTGAATLYANGGLPIQHGSNHEDVILTSEPKETRVFRDEASGQDVEYVLEHALPTDISLVKAAVADTLGNCRFVGTSQNSNADVAKAAIQCCVVEAETIVDAGQLHPDDIHLPGIYVHKVVPASVNHKPIERLKLSNNNHHKSSNNHKSSSTSTAATVTKPTTTVDTTTGRNVILRRAAKEFKNGMYVNLGIGLPTLASNYVPPNVTILLQTENGLLGMGPYPSSSEEARPDWINAGKETITALPGASSFSSSASFRMIRAGRVDLTLLGGLQVSRFGDLASWTVPGKIIKGMGGAMDLVGAPRSRVVVTMDHVAKDGTPKLVEKCTLPLTGHAVVDRVITDMGVFDCDKRSGSGRLTLVEISPFVSLDDVKNATGCDFDVVPGRIPFMVDEP